MKRLFYFWSILIFFSFNAYAFDIPPKPSNYVHDQTGVLSSDQIDQLSSALSRYDGATSNQIFVGVFKTLDGENLEDLSLKIAETWKPGQKNQDNGVLVLFFMDDRAVRIEVGYGLEATLTDNLSKRIISQIIVPNFRAGQYDLGVQAAVASLIKTISPQYQDDFTKRYAQKPARSKNSFLDTVFGILMFGLIMFAVSRRGGRTLGSHLLLGGLLGGVGRSGGGFSGGGFSGGGGGSFGGGGSSGRW